MSHEVSEKEKYIWKINDDLTVTKIALPTRGIYKLENPTPKDLEKIPKNSIVKVILTKKMESEDIVKLKEVLSLLFDSYILVEQYPSERKKVHFEDGMLEFTAENLLHVYAEEKGISEEKLLTAFRLI